CENLHRFFRAARGAGVRVSPAESIDAMRAVAQVGFNDRDILRDTFLLTLAKTQDEKRALGECFDLFFSQPEPQQESAEQNRTDDNGESGANPSADEHGDTSGGAADADVGPLAQMLLSQDRAAISTAIANASGAASLPDIRYFTQRGIFQTRILDA
ncbi:VWA containing CoxE family protein, partial [Klebsiella pneumoniae]|nr:VWA containing CoxE family protein [Klebsiella pneumoniae]